MYCVHCSTPVPDDATFCHRCGSAVSDADGQAAATAALNESHEQQLERLLRAETTGEFEIERLLGRGGMAMVYLAREIHLDRKVAIKVLPPELTFGHGVERFKREAKTAAALDHPHIIPIHRIASGGKLFWYTMKYVEGRSLEDHLREYKRLSLEQTLGILTPVADALDYAHEHQVIHRDIKPANVMIDERNRITVADFGIAKALTEATLTASGSVIGTPYYMSPEQGMGKQVSGTSDQYSVAVMAYRMLSGQVPFDGDSAIDILHKHCKEPPPPLKALVPGLPQYLYAAIQKALSKSPGDRFSTVSAFVKGLKQLSPEISAEMETVSLDVDQSIQDKINTEVIAISDADIPLPEKQADGAQAASGEAARPTRRPWLVAFAAVILAGGIAGVWWLVERPAPIDPEIQRMMAESDTATDLQGFPEAVAPPPAPTTGVVTVIGLPRSGTVSVNGERQADTVFELPAGSYTIAMSAAGFGSNETPLSVIAGGEHSLVFTGAAVAVTTGTVGVTGLPAGGEILVDGRRQRSATFELERGRHTIRMSAPGFHSVERQLDVTAGTGVTVEFTGLPMVASVSVAVASPNLTVGNEMTARVRPVDATGNALAGREVRWVSSRPAVASVSRDGLVRGIASGTASITATVEEQSASVDIRVIPVAVAAVRVTPQNSAVFAGETVQLSVSVQDASGRPLSDRAVTWQSSDPEIATVSPRGVVSGVRAGTATVTAQSEGQTGSSVLTVNAVAVDVNPQPPAPQPISGPEDLFTRAAPAGWSVSRGTDPVIAVYEHQELGTIRIFRAAEASPEAIIGGLRTALERRLTTLRELAPPEDLTTAGGESILIQRFDGREGSSFAETRWDVVLAAAKNQHRSVGVMALLTYYADREQAAADLRELLRSLR